jgi:uncharacterized protein YbjT (DUF2867 family)
MAKTIRITGASPGIGEAPARALLAAGHIVYAGARRIERMNPLIEAGGRALTLDVTDDRSMTTAVQSMVRATGRVDGSGAYADSAHAYVKFMQSADQGRLPSPASVVAKTILKAVASRRPKTRYATGGGAKPVLFLGQVLPDRAFDAMMLIGARPRQKASV